MKIEKKYCNRIKEKNIGMPFSLRERTLNTKYRRNRSDKNIVPQYVESDFENKIILQTQAYFRLTVGFLNVLSYVLRVRSM